MSVPARTERLEAVNELKRSFIVAAARRVFEAEGLEGASIRAIAKEAGYTPGALYFHFASKEAIYGAVMQELLERLVSFVDTAVAEATSAGDRFRRAAMAFFDFFADDPRDLDFGFYLFQGGMRPRGLSPELDAELNDRLGDSLAPIGTAARELGLGDDAANDVIADAFGHAAGLLLLKHTHRIRMFGSSPRALMEEYVERTLAVLRADAAARGH